MPKSPLEIIRKAEELQNPDVLAEVVLDIEEDVEEMEVEIEQIREIAETTKKEKGEKGDKGERGDKGDKGDSGKDGKNGLNGTNGKDGLNGRNGIDGLNGVDGLNGENGKDGSPDTGEQIVGKINSQSKKIESSKLDLSKVEKDIKELKEKPAIINNIMGGQGGASGIRDIRAGNNISITKVNDVYTVNSTASSETPSLQEVTDVGATTTNDISVPDEVYGAGWNGSMEVPTKNALYDKIETIGTGASLTYMFANIASDISTYKQAVSLNSYVAGTLGDQSGTATTSGVIIGKFATNLGFPNVTLIPAGTITIHYDTEKVAGSNNYYSRADIYKRNLAGTETLLASSDNSPSSALNTQQNITVTAVLASDTTLLATDRIVVKVVVTMASSTATVHVYGDDATSARIELPTAQIDATNYVTISTDQSITGTKTFLKAGIGTTVTDAVVYSNTTAATSGNQQISPAEHFSGRGWNSGGAGSSQSIDFRRYLLPVQDVSGATGLMKILTSRNGGSYSEIFSQSTSGEIVYTILSGVSATTGVKISAQFGNSTPGTTEHLRLSNSDQYTWITGYFTGTLKNAFGFAADGTVYYSSQNGYHNFYSGTTTLTLLSQIYSGGFFNAGGNFNAGRVGAGNSTTTPDSTLTSYGSIGIETTVITTSTTLTASHGHIIVDCSSNNSCTGTPSVTACSTYTASGQSTCESHLPCTWYAGDSCSVFNNEFGMGSCTGQSPCSADTSSCSPYNSDQTTCEAADDTYGGNCTWDAGTNTCPAQDCSTCAGAGCTPNLGGDCSSFSDGGGDGSMCFAAPCGSCSYDSGTGACSGNYFISCDGDNTTPSCNGTFFTGNCSGTYGTACNGTATCDGYMSSGACTGEAGCTWSSSVSITMPASPGRRMYPINKDYTSGTLTILPNSGQTINNTTSITSASTAGVGWWFIYNTAKSNWYIAAKN